MAFDFLGTIGQNRLYTFHSHTEFCDGHAQMEAFARAAIAQGFTHYGFTPHSPIPFYSSCNMPQVKVDDFFKEYDRINAQYGGAQCHFYAGMEIDYLNADWNAASERFQQMPLDYRLSSIHFIPSQQGEYIDIDGRFESFKRKMVQHFHNDIRYVVETFYDQSEAMIEAGGFDLLGHFDKIGHNGTHFHPGLEEEGWYQARVDSLIKKIIASGVTVELNTKAYREHGRFFPNPAYLQPLIEAGIPIIVNSDAHYPALINASRDEAFALLDSLATEIAY